MFANAEKFYALGNFPGVVAAVDGTHIVFDDFHMIQIINTPTRVTNKCSSTIDLIATNIDRSIIKHSRVLDYIISDHLPVYANIKRTKRKHEKVKSSVRSYRYYTYEDYSNVLLDNQDWRLFWLPTISIDERWKIFKEIIINNLNKICPLHKVSSRADQNAWVDGELLAAIKKKNKLYKNAKSIGCPNDSWKEYKEYSKYTRRLMVSKRKAYVTHVLIENKNDPKKFWQEINKNLSFGRSNRKSGCVCVKNASGELLSGMYAANALNSHYATVGENLASKIPTVSNRVRGPITNPLYPLVNQMSYRFVDVTEMTSLVKALKNGKPSGLPNIRTNVLKDALKILIIEFNFDK